MTCYKAFIINHKQSPFNEPFPLFDDCIFHQRFSIVSFGHFGLFSSRKGLANNLFSLCKIILSSFFYKDKFIRASSKKNVGEKPNDDKIWAKLHQSVSFTICKFRGIGTIQGRNTYESEALPIISMETKGKELAYLHLCLCW